LCAVSAVFFKMWSGGPNGVCKGYGGIHDGRAYSLTLRGSSISSLCFDIHALSLILALSYNMPLTVPIQNNKCICHCCKPLKRRESHCRKQCCTVLFSKFYPVNVTYYRSQGGICRGEAGELPPHWIWGNGKGRGGEGKGGRDHLPYFPLLASASNTTLIWVQGSTNCA